jgi:hypothetical protein
MSFRTIAALATTVSLVGLVGCAQPPAGATDFETAPTYQPTHAAESTAAPVSPLPTARSQQDGRITIVEEPRNGVALPTFMHATAEELQRDERIQVATTRIDGNLRPDHVPAAVIAFHTTGSHFTGRLYILPHADGERYVVVTCIGSMQDLDDCLATVDTVSLSD